MALLQRVEGKLHTLQGRPADLAGGTGQRQQDAEFGGVNIKCGFERFQALVRCVGVRMAREGVGQAAQGVDFGLHVTGSAVPLRQFGHKQVAGIGSGKAMRQDFELRHVEVVADDLAEPIASFFGQIGVSRARGQRQLGDGLPIGPQGERRGAEVVVGAGLLRRGG